MSSKIDKSDKNEKPLSRRDFLRIAASTTAASTLVAVAPDVAFAAPPKLEAATISVWGWPTQMTRYLDESGNEQITDKVMEDLGLTLELNLVEQPDLGPKLKAALPAGTGPDVVTTDFDVMGPYWSFMSALDGYAETEWGGTWRTDVFSDTALSEMEVVAGIVGKPGEAFYLPGNMQLLGWPYYWISTFEENEIDASALNTFDDFTAACDKLKAAGIIPLIGANHPASLADWFKSLVEVAAPGKMEKVQYGEGLFTDADMVDTFNLIAKVFNEYMQEGAIAADTGESFNTFHTKGGAMVATFTGTPWFGFLNNDNEDVRNNMRNNYGTFKLPGSKGLASTDAGVAIVDASPNKDNAWLYIKWATTGNGAMHAAEVAAQPFGAKAITPAPTGTDFDKNLGEPLFAALQSSDNVFRRILCPDVYNAITIAIPGVVTGQITADIAAADVQDAFDQNCGKWMR